jgi:integrase
MFFDARSAKLLTPGAHLVIPGCPGLRLVATASTRAWVYRFKVDGLMKQTKIGLWPAMPAASAAAKWQALRDARASGEDVQAIQRPKPTPKTYAVADLVNDYITGHVRERRGEAGALASERALLRFLAESHVLARKQATSVTRADCFDALDVRKAIPTAAARLRSLLGAAWDYALDAGRLPGESVNWWRLVMRGRLKSKGKIVGGVHLGTAKRVLSRAEVAELLAWLPNMHALGRDVTVMYLWTCCRCCEIVGMRPEHIKREGAVLWWTIPASLTKNAGNPRAVDHRVPLLGRALEVVQRRLGGVGESGWLFWTERGGQYTQNDFSTYLYSLNPTSAKSRARQGEGLVLPVLGWTAHDLRRTGRTLLAEMGCPQEVAEAILGHLPTVIVGTYNRSSYDAQRVEWLGRLSQALTA